MGKQDRALLVQFVTGTSKVPLDGFSALQVRRTLLQLPGLPVIRLWASGPCAMQVQLHAGPPLHHAACTRACRPAAQPAPDRTQ